MKILITIAALIAVPVAAQTSSSEARQACVVRVLESRDAAFETLQVQLTRAIAMRAPGLSPAAKSVERGQLAMRAASTARVHYLIETEPDVLAGPMSLSTLVNMPLDEAQLTALRSANPGYADLEAARDAAIAKTQTGFDMERMRSIVRSAAADPEDLGATLVTFGEINEALELAFQECLNAP